MRQTVSKNSTISKNRIISVSLDTQAKETEWIKDNPKIKPKALLDYKFTFDCVAIGREMLDFIPKY